MKKLLFISKSIRLFLCFCLSISLLINVIYVRAQEQDKFLEDEILRASGMPQDEIDALDNDIKKFIVNDLKNNANLSDLKYIDISDSLSPSVSKEIRPLVNQVFYDIKFYVSAFKSGDVIYIYPTYEFTEDHQPKGKDSFSFQLGDAMRPYEYGGQIWYKDYTMSDWALGGSLVANNQGFNGAEYSGAQLGSPDWPMKMKGCAYCHAQVGTGSDKRIIMCYMHNPKGEPYSISFSVRGLGITYNSSATIYTNASTFVLSY